MSDRLPCPVCTTGALCPVGRALLEVYWEQLSALDARGDIEGLFARHLAGFQAHVRGDPAP